MVSPLTLNGRTVSGMRVNDSIVLAMSAEVILSLAALICWIIPC